MLIDLVHATTADGVRLFGALETPRDADDSKSGDVRPPVEAIVCVHGTGSNFYASTLMEAIAARLVEQGIAALRVNTRGHDGISTASGRTGPVRGGAAYEKVDDCRYDLAAWVALLQARGYERVGLLGHSLGAVKSIYALAHAAMSSGADADNQTAAATVALRRVACLVALSPPHLSHAYFLASPRGEEFRAAYERAEALVREGHGERLIDATFPLPYVVSAAGYADKYGPDERYNVLRLLPSIDLPTLITYGSDEVAHNVAFAGMPDAIEALQPAAANRRMAVIAGGDHFYAGVRGELLMRIERWLRQLGRG